MDIKCSKDNTSNKNVTEQTTGKYLSSFQLKFLKKNLQNKLRSEYRRRIEIMLLTDRGYSQTEICAALNCAHETARYWMLMAQTGQAHKWQTIPVGRPKTINETYLNRLRDLVCQSPRLHGYAFSRWTAKWLSEHLAKEYDIHISDRHINRLLKQMGLSTVYKPSKILVTKETEPVKGNSQGQNITISNLNDKCLPETLQFSPFNKL